MYTRNWESLQRPQKIEVEKNTYGPSYGKFIVEPLEKGFGTTIGHSLRRVLLSSMQGCAPIAVKIEGVSHEFESLNGVKEDVVQIILNLKSVQLKQLEDGIHELELVGAGPAKLTAGDIVTGGMVEVMNPDQVIATLDEGAELEMRIWVGMNKGYITSEENKEEDLSAEAIYLDSVHTPIRKINYSVENARVGQQTDYDRLIFEVWTNGALEPADAMAYAAKIIKEYMTIFINFDEAELEPARMITHTITPGQNSVFNENLYKSVSELELSVRSINCLQNAKIETIGDLVQKTEQEMLKTKNFGRKSLNEIKHILNNMGLSLGMKLEGFDPANKPQPPQPQNEIA